MEELLPLIIGILWLVYTFYTKGQKKKASDRTSSGVKTKEKPSFLEQLLSSEGIQLGKSSSDDFEEEYYSDQIEEEQEDDIRIESAKPSPFLKEELSTYEEEGQAQFKEAFALDENEDVEVYDIPGELSGHIQEFDLRKAVVFSAILETPYIDYK